MFDITGFIFVHLFLVFLQGAFLINISKVSYFYKAIVGDTEDVGDTEHAEHAEHVEYVEDVEDVENAEDVEDVEDV